MDYLVVLIIVIAVLFLANIFSNRKKANSDKAKMKEFIANGFPEFSKMEQLEMLYNDDYSFLHERLQVSSISNHYFDNIFTVTKEDLIDYIKGNKNILEDKSITLNHMDGFWTSKEENDFLYQHRERGQIQSTEKLSSLEELIDRFVNDMVWIIPKYSENKLETTIIKR